MIKMEFIPILKIFTVIYQLIKTRNSAMKEASGLRKFMIIRIRIRIRTSRKK